MGDTITETNVIKLKVKTAEGLMGALYATVSLKNPLFDTDTLVTKIGEINTMLTGELQNMWFPDAPLARDDNPFAEIVKAELFEQTKTVSEDGKTIQTVSRLQEFYNTMG